MLKIKERITATGKTDAGFTLVELIIVMVLVGILSAIGVTIVLPPFKAAGDMERRARLVDHADLALSYVRDEVRHALPNSVRADGNELTFIRVIGAGAYRRLAGDNSNAVLVPASAVGSFDMLTLETTPGFTPADFTGKQVSVYNTGQPGFDAWDGDNLATITGSSGNLLSYTGGSFTTHSPQQRFFVVDQAVRYTCTAGELRRFQYPLDSTPTGIGELISKDVSGCNFDYDPGSSSRHGLLTASLTLMRGNETISLLVQSQVSNSP